MSEKEKNITTGDAKVEERSLTVRIGPSGDLTLKDTSSGKSFVLKSVTPETEDDNDDDDSYEIPVEEFRAVLVKIRELGMTWSADVIPRIKLKESTGGDRGDRYSSPEFLRLTEKYPYLPYELGAIVRSVLMGKVKPSEIGENEDTFYQKAAIVKEMVVTPEFRSEFYFNQSIKVPHFSEVDWEVVVKAYENNVNERPNFVYGLLALNLIKPENPWEGRSKSQKQSITVAVNEQLADKLIQSLQQLKAALRQAEKDVKESAAEPRGSHAANLLSS